jgi:hypothetical protein
VLARYENLWTPTLALIGAGAVVGGMIPIARPAVAIGWIAFLPLGMLSIILAVLSVGGQGRTPGAAPLDKSMRSALLRLAVGLAFGGLLSSWFALSVYPGVILQSAGVASGIGFLWCSTIIFGWCEGMRRRANEPY